MAEWLTQRKAMTSLAKQLQKLAIPGQPSLARLASTRARASLLFDARQAADIDLDTVFSLGRNGLEELIGLDASFASYEASLFRESCKDFERTVQTRDTLERLDETISRFLWKLSPYFLLKPAQKCLEWLVRAFGVHTHNTDALLECALPYHETRLFARLLQLLPLRGDRSRWHWLLAAQRAGAPLSRLTLVRRCAGDPTLLDFVGGMVRHLSSAAEGSERAGVALRTVTAFYASTVVAVLETAPVTEELVSSLLPHLVDGLKSSGNLDRRAASYVIVGQLVSKATLEPRLSTSLIESISKVID